MTRAFVTLANSLVDDFDVVELLNGLTASCAQLLDIASAGVLLADRRQVLHVLAASSEATRNLELFQLQRDEGPCLDSYHHGAPVTVPDLDKEADRWPEFVRAASKAGFASVHAVPMRLQGHRLGTLGLFGRHVGSLSEDDMSLAQALAHVGSVAVVQGTAVADKARMADQLQAALDSRVVLEQAKGVLSQVGDLDMDDAFSALRSYARNHNERLADVARALVSRQLSARQLLLPVTKGAATKR